MQTIVCQVCKLEKRRQFGLGSDRKRETNTRKTVQREIGLQRVVCSDCLQFWKYQALSGSRKSLEGVTNKARLNGKFAEIEAARFLRKSGYEIATTNSTGPDIILSLNNRHYRIEIKSVSFFNGRHSVNPVYPKRKSDHIIGYRFNIRDFVWSTMAEHLSYCDPGGWRDVEHLNNENSFQYRTFERALGMVTKPTYADQLMEYA